MLDRLSQLGASLAGAAGVALLLYARISLAEDIRIYEDLARVSQPVHARLLSVGVRAVSVGGRSNRPRYNYTPVGTFEIVGKEGPAYENVDRDDGTLRAAEAEAKRAAAQYREGMVVDAWFDPRSQNSDVFFPLSVIDPARVAEEKRAARRLFTWIGGGSVLAGCVFFGLLIRRSRVT
jgi:hypothetical protein